jgi:hypothetical protein
MDGAMGGEYYISKASVVFFYLLFAGRSAKLRCAGRRAGDIIFHSIGRREIIVYLRTVEYQCVCPIVGIVSPPPPPLKLSMSPSLDISGKISDTFIIGFRVLL